MARVALVGLAAALAALLSSDGRASLHHPEDKQTGVVPLDEKGQLEALPFDAFKLRRVTVRNIGNPDWPLEEIDPQTKEKIKDPKTGLTRPTERGVVDARIKKLQKKPEAARTEQDRIALAIDLLRFGRPEDAAGVLGRHRETFLENATLAHVAIAQGQWLQARNYLDIANEIATDKRKPPTVPGVPPDKLAAAVKINTGPLMKFIRLRQAEASEAAALKAKNPPERVPVEDELPDQIWPVKFVNDAGVYEPGALAAAEKAKLPGGNFEEALATVQQLVLWFPFDVRLYWLLGELYAAKGDFKSALDIMNECVDSGRYSNRKVLMEHRELLKKAANVAPTPDDTAPPVPFTFRAVWIYFGAVGVLGLLALVRAVLKWRAGKK